MVLLILDEFIFKSILSRVLIMKNDGSEHKDYKANLARKNEDNNLHHIIRSAVIYELEILSGYIIIDVNKSKPNLYLKLISTIYNLSDDNITKDKKTSQGQLLVVIFTMTENP